MSFSTVGLLQVNFTQESYTVSENDGVEICVLLSGQIGRSIAIDLTTVDGTATGKFT